MTSSQSRSRRWVLSMSRPLLFCTIWVSEFLSWAGRTESLSFCFSAFQSPSSALTRCFWMTVFCRPTTRISVYSKHYINFYYYRYLLLYLFYLLLLTILEWYWWSRCLVTFSKVIINSWWWVLFCARMNSGWRYWRRFSGWFVGATWTPSIR